MIFVAFIDDATGQPGSWLFGGFAKTGTPLRGCNLRVFPSTAAARNFMELWAPYARFALYEGDTHPVTRLIGAESIPARERGGQ